MSVRKRKDGRWQLDFYYVDAATGEKRRYKRAAKGAKNRSEALAQEQKKRAELERGGAVQAGEAPLLEDFAKEFLDTYARVTNKPAEQESKEAILRLHVTPFFGKMRLDKVGPRDIERFKAAALEEGTAAKTINNRLTVLRRLYAVAKEWGRVAAVPTIRWLKTPEPEFDFFDAAESARLVEGADAGQWRCMVLVALRTGLRVGELIALRWDDVDLVTRRIVVRKNMSRGVIGTPKGGRSREVELSPAAVASLRELPSRFAGALVFPGEDGRHLTRNACKHPLWRACRRAGLRRVGWHVLRHSTASQLVMAGVPMRAVQELLGHRDIKQTMRYSHLSPDVRSNAVALLDGAAAPAGKGKEKSG